MKNIKYITAGLLIVCMLISILFIVSNRHRPKFTEEEEQYIKDHIGKTFLTGYFPTPSEKRFAVKLIEKIEEDTSLHLELYDNTWSNSLELLEKGTLPIVMNMNKTEKRSEFTLFTNSLIPITCGIYSNSDSEITNFSDIKDKTIGVEANTALSESFLNEYPNLDYNLKIYDTFQSTRNAFSKREIDGFLSTKSFDQDVKGLYFFGIESISQDTNHIGVSKKFPILYSILKKEIDYLIEEEWDSFVSDIINFELERTMIDFTNEEKKYMEDTKSFIVGLPKEYFLYAYGNINYPEGFIPEILEKIEFICDINFIYEYDSLKNLRLRDDINVYIDNYESKDYASNTVFNDEVIILGTSKQRTINERYDLSPYNVGIFGIPNLLNELVEDMPNIKIEEYHDFDTALKDKNLDYIILSNNYFNQLKIPSSLIVRGELTSRQNFFVSNDKKLIEIISKSLAIINTNGILSENILLNTNKLEVYFYIAIAILCVILLFLIRRIYIKLKTEIYYDDHYKLKNMKYLEKKIIGLEAYLIMIDINNAKQINLLYGNKVFDYFVNNLHSKILKKQDKSEYLIYVDLYRRLLVKSREVDIESYIDYLQKTTIIRNLSLEYKLDISYLDIESEDMLEDAYCKLEMGLELAREKDKAIYYTQHLETMNRNKIERRHKITEKINNGDINLNIQELISGDEQLLGLYIEPKIEEISMRVLHTIIGKKNIALKLDKILLEMIVKRFENTGQKIFVEISESTLCIDGFCDWIEKKLSSQLFIYFIISSEIYERNLEVLEKRKNINYVIGNFGKDLAMDFKIKHSNIDYIWLNELIVDDFEESEEILDSIHNFAKRYHKKIIATRKIDSTNYFVRGNG